jgi:sugar lactone lactonase YvrE
MIRRIRALLIVFSLAALLATGGCAPSTEEAERSSAETAKVTYQLTETATSDRLWTGLAIGSGGRLFVAFPRWSPDVPVTVAEIVDGEPVPYPNAEINAWSPDEDPGERFVCVQSVITDAKKSLWILDPANPGFAGVVEGGPKLLRYNLVINRHVATYPFSDPVVMPDSYLNDVRIDLEAGAAYMTDSGNGAIIVTDLKSGSSRRLLDDHPSTEAEEIVLTIEGKEWLQPDGESPRVHADGIALDPDGRFLYFQALTSRTLYRVPTEALRDESLSEADLAGRVEMVGKTGASDGLIFGADGWLYISAIEENAIKRLDPATREVETVVQSEMIKWPDTFARDGEGRVHFTTSQIHLGQEVTEPFRIFRIDEIR